MEELSVTISNSHVDNKKEIKIPEIINLLQDIEGIHINELDEFNKFLIKENVGVFLMYREVNIITKPKFSDKVTLSTYPFQTNSVSGYRHIYLRDQDNNILVNSTAFGAFINLDTYLPVRVPKDIIKTIGDKEKDPDIIIEPRKIDFNDSLLKYTGSITVRKSHIDRYNHLNNAHYITFALDFLEEINFDKIRAEYKKAFLIGDIIKMYKELLGDKTIVVFKNELDEIYTVIEFSKNK